MEYAPQLTPQAREDIAEASRYIATELENPQAAIDLVNGIYDVIYGLDVMPKRNPVWPRDLARFAGRYTRTTISSMPWMMWRP